MEKKINSHKYLTLDDFERDFTLVWRNAMTYNEPTTVYYRAALRIKLEGQRMLKVARDNLVKYAADPLTEISQLFTNAPKSQGETPNSNVSEGNNAPNDSNRKECEFSDTANNRTLWPLCVCGGGGRGRICIPCLCTYVRT